MFRLILMFFCLLAAAPFAHAEDKIVAPPVAPPRARAAVMPGAGRPQSFADIQDGDGKWIIMPAPSISAQSRECSASYQPGMEASERPMSVNFLRLHNKMTVSGVAEDTLQISLNSMAPPKSASQGVTLDGNDINAAVTGAGTRSALARVTDIAAFTKKIEAGSWLVFRLDDQHMGMTAKTGAQILEKLEACMQATTKEN